MLSARRYIKKDLTTWLPSDACTVIMIMIKIKTKIMMMLTVVMILTMII